MTLIAEVFKGGEAAGHGVSVAPDETGGAASGNTPLSHQLSSFR